MNEHQNLSANASQTIINTSEWVNFNWKAIENRVQFLRYRIFNAAKKQDSPTTIRLQQLMLNSSANILFAIKKITSNNPYQYLSGIEKIRLYLIQDLMNIDLGIYRPIIYKNLIIPKTSRKQKLLKIQIIKDQCIQLIIKNALEPQWEAQFEENLYGARPGRCSHDAIAHAMQIICTDNLKKWVVQADFAQSLDNLNGEIILKKLSDFPRIDLILKWLKAGSIHSLNSSYLGFVFVSKDIIYSLLINIAFDDFDKILKRNYSTITTKYFYLRYISSLLIFSESKETAVQDRNLLSLWCKHIGIQFIYNQIQIHSLSNGFPFLGIEFSPKRHKNQFMTLLPNQEAQKEIRSKLKTIWMRGRGKDVQWVLDKLNPRIREWCNYYCFYKSSQVFKDIDNWMFQRSVRYCKRTHPNKSWTWIQHKYFGRFNAKRNSRWIFGDKETGKYLTRLAWTSPRRYSPIQIQACPDNIIYRDYWIKRNATGINNNQLWNLSDFKIAQRQNHICPICELSLYNHEPIEKHRIIIRKAATQIYPFNMIFVHSMCYQCVKK